MQINHKYGISLTPARTVSCNILCIYWDAIVSEFINKSTAGLHYCTKAAQQHAREPTLQASMYIFPIPPPVREAHKNTAAERGHMEIICECVSHIKLWSNK
jgi:hypothetical protein